MEGQGEGGELEREGRGGGGDKPGGYLISNMLVNM